MPDSVMDPIQVTSEELPMVDCDIHVYPNELSDLKPYLPKRFQDVKVDYPTGNWINPVGNIQENAILDQEKVTFDSALLCESYLDKLNIDHGIITGGGLNLRASVMPDRRYATALTRAYNDWLISEWLEEDERLKGSISVNPQSPQAAAEEIDRVGDNQNIVQVIIGSGTKIALGEQRYWPIYEAAVEKGLPVAIHAGSEGYGVANPNTGAGYPGSYLEKHSVIPANFMGQLLNLVFEGAFVEFPNLRIVMVGGGYSWIPSFLWRIDKAWKGLTDDMPWVENPPSEYVHEQMRIVTHCIDEPRRREHIESMLEMVNAEEILMFGSNYPHWDSYAPGNDLPELSDSLRQSIFSETATELYEL